MTAVEDPGCGGCRGMGAHRQACPHRPGYSVLRVFAAMAESLGDRIGSNAPREANRAYGIAARLRSEADYREAFGVIEDHDACPGHRNLDGVLLPCDLGYGHGKVPRA